MSAWFFLVELMVLPGMGVAGAVLVYLIFKRPPDLERTTNYRVNDLVVVAYQGQKKARGRIDEITALRPGQLPLTRIATIVVKFESDGEIYRDKVRMPLWQIKGLVPQHLSRSVHDTAYYLAQESKWLLWGTEKERAR